MIPTKTGTRKNIVYMEVKVKDLTVEELQSIISDTVRSTLEDLIEDMLALSSKEYLHSIEEARKDYRDGKIKCLEDIIVDFLSDYRGELSCQIR